MAVDTPVLERITNEKQTKESAFSSRCAVPSRMEILEEDVHNARIRETYQRLINPDSKIEDVFTSVKTENVSPVEEVAEVKAPAEEQPYRVESARATSMLFRADSAINRVEAVATVEEQSEDIAEEVVAAAREEEDEDLRPTPTTIQYQTVGLQGEKKIESTTDKRAHVFGKREKIILAVFVAVVVALITLVIVNSAIISNLNSEISSVQNGITTVKAAIAGANAEIDDLIQSAIGLGH